jgi:hypothetical protein
MDVDRFIHRVVDSEEVWYLSSDTGVATCTSNRDESNEPPAVLLFFSDVAYARRAQESMFPVHEAASMDLFDFLYRWLPGMTGDGVYAGPNWTGDLVGLELEPYSLREQIETAMSQNHLESYEQRYRELTGTS